MEAKLKHLEFIQGAINRLATDSFRMKGWAVVLVSALLVLLAREDHTEFTYIGFVPVLGGSSVRANACGGTGGTPSAITRWTLPRNCRTYARRPSLKPAPTKSFRLDQSR